jgi:hypothetical protein
LSDDHRDVVRAAVAVGPLDEGAGCYRGSVSRYCPGQLPRWDEIGETVRTEKHSITRLQLEGAKTFEMRWWIQIHADRGVNAQRAGYHVAIAILPRLLGSDEPQVDFLLGQGMVAGELLSAPVTNEVSAAVSHVDHVQPVPVNHRRGEGGATFSPSRLQQVSVEGSIGKVYGFAETSPALPMREVVVVFDDVPHRPPAGFLARR